MIDPKRIAGRRSTRSGVPISADEDAPCVRRAKRIDPEYTQPVLTAFRGRIFRLLAFCVFVLTFGLVQVNTTGRATADGPGRDDTHISTKNTP
jgi:hypothetical protein